MDVSSGNTYLKRPQQIRADTAQPKPTWISEELYNIDYEIPQDQYYEEQYYEQPENNYVQQEEEQQKMYSEDNQNFHMAPSNTTPT
jgi:hypothetical protein